MKNPIHIYACVFLTGISLGWVAHHLSDRGPGINTQQHQVSKANAEAVQKARSRIVAKTEARQLTSKAVADFVNRHAPSGRISGEGMAGAIEEMSKTNDLLLRKALFNTIVDHLDTENAAGAYASLVKHSRIPAGQDQEILLVANAWGRLSPLEALNSISKVLRRNDTWPEGIVWDTPDMAEVLAGWAMTDPGEASKFLESATGNREFQQNTTGKKELLSQGLVRGLLARGTDEAMAYILNLPATGENLAARQNYMGMVANDVLKQRGFESSITWLDSIEDKSLKTSGFTQLAEDTKSLKDGTAGKARDWAVRHATEDAAKDAICILAKAWAEDSPSNAMKWADDNFPENIREIVYSDSFAIFARRNASGASGFLDTLPPSRARDSAVVEFSKIIATDEPVSAIKWAETIEDGSKRTEALTSIAATWLKSDYEAAVNWLAGSKLSN